MQFMVIPELKVYSAFLAVNFFFILLILRACYYIFIVKSDPIKSILPEYPTKFAKRLLKRMDENKDAKDRSKFS